MVDWESIDDLRDRIEAAALRILGCPPGLWRVTAEMHALRFELRRNVEMREQLSRMQERALFAYVAGWKPVQTTA